MEENKKVQEENAIKKMSYEELQNAANQLSLQVKQLYTKLQEANMVNMFKRIEYLFKVLELKDSFKASFVKGCAAELVNVLTLKEDKETTEDK